MITKHLLPVARAWRITTEKQLRQFFVGLSGLEVDVRAFIDGVWSDIGPQTTRELEAWERQFGLRDIVLTEQERRDRLAAAWAATGGQSPRYIQDTLQAAGFDVYVHEWWEPGTEPPLGVSAAATARSPVLWLQSDSGTTRSGVDCGEALAECGEVFAECGNGTEAPGYPLVNRGPGVVYTVPVDSSKWPYFIYIGAGVFGDMAAVPTARKDEFEALCLGVCPAQNWLGMLVNYS